MKTNYFKSNLSYIERAGLITLFNKFYLDRYDEKIDARFFYNCGVLSSEDMANGYPIFIQHYGYVSHIGLDDDDNCLLCLEDENGENTIVCIFDEYDGSLLQIK